MASSSWLVVAAGLLVVFLSGCAAGVAYSKGKDMGDKGRNVAEESSVEEGTKLPHTVEDYPSQKTGKAKMAVRSPSVDRAPAEIPTRKRRSSGRGYGQQSPRETAPGTKMDL